MTHAAFSGGRAPRVWRRGMARAVAPLGALRRSAAWLAGLARVRLGLQDGPLLGRSFHEIASQPFPAPGARQPEARPKPTRPRFPEPAERAGRPASPEPGSHRERRPSPPLPRREEEPGTAREEGRAVRDRRSAAEPLVLEARAERALIERWAGRVKVDAERPHPLSPSPISRPGLRPAPAGRGGTPPDRHLDDSASPSQPGPPSPGDGAGGRWERGTGGEVFARYGRAFRKRLNLLERLAGTRVGGALSGATAPGREGEGSSLAPTEKDPSPTLPRYAGEGATALPRGVQELQDLPAPERLSLAGETAPAELLERWRTPGMDAPVRSARPSSPASPASPAPRSLPAPAREETAPPVPARQAGEPAHRETTLPPPPPSLLPFLRSNGAGDGLAGHPAAEARPSLAPVAGPAAPPAEDLDALASKIQRILDEEARRHGISV
ncbi:MAG: hypothetical protein ABUT39_08895 [Acidobacteriota bacterium]